MHTMVLTLNFMLDLTWELTAPASHCRIEAQPRVTTDMAFRLPPPPPLPPFCL